MTVPPTATKALAERVGIHPLRAVCLAIIMLGRTSAAEGGQETHSVQKTFDSLLTKIKKKSPLLQPTQTRARWKDRAEEIVGAVNAIMNLSRMERFGGLEVPESQVGEAPEAPEPPQ